MDEPHFKSLAEDRRRLVRIIVIQGVILTVILVIAILVGTWQLSNIKHQLQQLRSTPRIVQQDLSQDQMQELKLSLMPENGKDGKDGADGQSIKGDPGDNGINATPSQIAQAVTTYLQVNPPPKGDTGKTGKNGKDAREMQLCFINPLLLGYRYTGDTECQEAL